MTKKIENVLAKYPLYSQDGVNDKKVVCKFFCPYSNYKWYVTEGSIENGDWVFFGLVINNYGDREYGYFSLNELQSTKVNVHGVMLDAVERDIYFEPSLISKISELEDED